MYLVVGVLNKTYDFRFKFKQYFLRRSKYINIMIGYFDILLY